MQKEYRWSEFKIKIPNEPVLDCIENSDNYRISLQITPDTFTCIIYKNEVPWAVKDYGNYTQEQNDLDKVDWEQNYLSNLHG